MTSRIEWPPKAAKVRSERGRQLNADGTPTWVALRRYPHDHTLRGQLSNACCDCGLTHLQTYEVVREARGQWWLVKRTYRVGTLGKKLT